MMDKSAIFGALWAAWGAQPADGSAATVPACCERKNNADFSRDPSHLGNVSFLCFFASVNYITHLDQFRELFGIRWTVHLGNVGLYNRL